MSIHKENAIKAMKYIGDVLVSIISITLIILGIIWVAGIIFSPFLIILCAV
jgi:hypothetical protein